MDSLVLELQRAAMDSATPVTDLLRKALVVATKLNLSQFKGWVENELNGYTSDVPDYRKFHGRVGALNPVTHRWMPVVFSHNEAEQAYSACRVGQNVASLEALLADKSQRDLFMPFSAQTEYSLMRDTGCPVPPTVLIQRSNLLGILDAIRNEVLQWSLRLESGSILGEGMSFTQQEKEIASRNAATLAPPMNIVCIGQAAGSQLQQGTVGSSQSASLSPLNTEAVSGLVKELKTMLPSLRLGADDASVAESDLATIETQVASPRPKIEIVRECLQSIRAAAQRGSGKAAARVVEAITKVLGG